MMDDLKKENDNLKKFVSYLCSHFSNYEDVISFEQFFKKTKKQKFIKFIKF